MTKSQLTITLAQLNPVVGDVTGNAVKARAARAQAASDGADLLVFSELFIAGYPPEDLVLKTAFQAACRAEIEALARETSDGGPAVLIGTPWVEDGKLYNACALLDEGRICGASLQGQSAELRRVRRKARVRARTRGRTGDDPRGAGRRSHL
jgi:NAD+ synthase